MIWQLNITINTDNTRKVVGRYGIGCDCYIDLVIIRSRLHLHLGGKTYATRLQQISGVLREAVVGLGNHAKAEEGKENDEHIDSVWEFILF